MGGRQAPIGGARPETALPWLRVVLLVAMYPAGIRQGLYLSAAAAV